MSLFIERPRGAYAPAGQAFPIGSVFISVVSTNPATLLGYGTWSAFGAGRVMVGLDSGDTDFDTAEETGGAKTVASAGGVAAPADHAAHTHTGPSHQHNLSGGAATAHSHDYTTVIAHTHKLATGTGASGNFAQVVGTIDASSGGTGAAPTQSNLDTASQSTGSATGTTANNAAGATDNAGTGATGNPSATLTHNAPAFTGTATSVVQPYIVCYFWKRTA